MKALILNSGMGSRMGEETRNHPKCMTRLNSEDTILSRQLRQLFKAGIRDVVMTTGYGRDVLMEYTDRIAGSMNVTYVENKKYDTTNYIYSIYLAESCLNEDILLLHGDLVFDDSVLRKLLEAKGSCMAVDSTAELPQKDFKAVISGGRIVKVGVEFFEQAAAAQPFYKLLWNDWSVWLNEIKEFCQQGRVTCYAEAAFNQVSDRCMIMPLELEGGLCGEIDTVDDWEKINSVLLKNV